jgi:hypothetical protein
MKIFNVSSKRSYAMASINTIFDEAGEIQFSMMGQF